MSSGTDSAAASPPRAATKAASAIPAATVGNCAGCRTRHRRQRAVSGLAVDLGTVQGVHHDKWARTTACGCVVAKAPNPWNTAAGPRPAAP